jgi:heme-degrading monooxygenase HmoA
MSDATSPLAHTPEPPYYAVIFSSLRSSSDPEDYARVAGRMVELAAAMPGYLGIESARGADGTGITVSYWASLEAIDRWREHAAHRTAQQLGRTRFYETFRLRVARVERDHLFERDR